VLQVKWPLLGYVLVRLLWRNNFVLLIYFLFQQSGPPVFVSNSVPNSTVQILNGKQNITFYSAEY